MPADSARRPWGDRLRGQLTYGLYRVVAALARGLPAWSVEPVAAVSGCVAARILRRRRHVVARTLARIAGDPHGRVPATVVDAVFGSYARYWLETFRLPGSTRDELDRSMEVRGLSHIDRAREAGRGVVIVTPHLGGWDFGGAWLTAHGYPLTTVVEVLDPPALFTWFVRLREALGVEVVRHDRQALDRLRAALAAGRVVALVSDRDLGRRGVPVVFFGEPTTLPAGPARLALEHEVPILAAAVYFRPHGGHEAVVCPPIPVVRTGDGHADVLALTQAIAAELETLIAAAPTQWHLLQPNWPADEPLRPRR